MQQLQVVVYSADLVSIAATTQPSLNWVQSTRTAAEERGLAPCWRTLAWRDIQGGHVWLISTTLGVPNPQ